MATVAQDTRKNLGGDVFGGLASALVALPSAIAYGIIVYAPLGSSFGPQAAIAGILGTIVLGLTAALIGGSSRLISAPCAPAAAVLSVFTGGLVASSTLPLESIPFAITITVVVAGLAQVLVGLAGGGRLIKYIPYPVVAGYMTGVGALILIGQVPKILSAPKGTDFWVALFSPGLWEIPSVVVGIITMIAMVAAARFIKAIPAAIVALGAGIGGYFILGIFDRSLLSFVDNHLVIGPMSASPLEVLGGVIKHWDPRAMVPALGAMASFTIPMLTLAVLLSIDALKTCVVLDAMTGERHNSNRVLLGQGIGNLLTGLLGGMPGAGTMGASLVNYNSGGQTKRSGILMGVFSLVALFALGGLVAWIPRAALSGVLVVIAIRMMDFKALRLLKNKSTVFDFLVILAVVVAAVTQDLIVAAGVGIAMAILLFLREQIRFSVIHRSYTAARVHSKKRRLPSEIDVLESQGDEVAVFELQGQLFFGTTDQLYTELEPWLKKARIIILDLRRVMALDYTAANLLKQIHKRLADRSATLVLAQIPSQVTGRQNIGEYLGELGISEHGTSLLIMGNLDTALEWAEDTLLLEKGARSDDKGPPLAVSDFEFFTSFSPELVELFAGIMVPASYGHGVQVFRKGDLSNEIYFVRRGMVKVMLPLGPSDQAHHLATFGRGDFFGEMAFLDKAPRSADAICVEETELFILKRSEFKRVLEQNPDMGTQFYSQLARTVAGRLRLNHAELQAMEGA